MFTQPCFIRKNTSELRKKLEELGYIPIDMNLLLEKLLAGSDGISSWKSNILRCDIYSRICQDVSK